MIKEFIILSRRIAIRIPGSKEYLRGIGEERVRRMNPQEPLGKIEAGEKFFVTKNDSHTTPSKSERNLWQMPLPHDLRPLRFAYLPHRPNAQMLCRGGIS